VFGIGFIGLLGIRYGDGCFPFIGFPRRSRFPIPLFPSLVAFLVYVSLKLTDHFKKRFRVRISVIPLVQQWEKIRR
jgi:hypothetical protein